MGKVLTALRISPEDGVEFETIIAKLKEITGFNTAKVEDYVFGSKILKASFVCEDKDAVDYEEVIQKVPGVGEVTVEEVGLI